MKSQDEIEKLATYYKDTFYSDVRTEQSTDDEYFRDKFNVKQLESVIPLSRTGSGARLINAPVQQITSSEIKILVYPKKESKTLNEQAVKLSKILNEEWLPQLLRQNPHPVREPCKNIFVRGEGWWYPGHNAQWVFEPTKRTGLPIKLMIPDPMNVFASPVEDQDGVPEHVILIYDRLAWIIKAAHPDWKTEKEVGASIKWIEYIDNDQHYAQADGEVVFNNPNIYGRVPFIHKISPWGKMSPEGKMSDMIVGRIRPERDLLMRECALTSSYDAGWHQFMLHELDVTSTDPQREVPVKFEQEYTRAWGALHRIPSWVKVTPTIANMPGPEGLNYLMSLGAQIEGRVPSVLTGAPQGKTGRLQDITYSTAVKENKGIIESIQNGLSTALTMALTMIERVPTLDPILGIEDIADKFDIRVELKPSNPMEEARESERGSRLLERDEIDPITNLVQFKGYTQDRAYEIQKRKYAWRVIDKNPIIMELIGRRVAEQAGLLEEYMGAMEGAKQMGKQQQALKEETPPSRRERILGERETPVGKEQLDFFGSQPGADRNPPEGYTRE